MSKKSHLKLLLEDEFNSFPCYLCQKVFIFVLKRQKLLFLSSNPLACTILWILIIFTMPHRLPLPNFKINLERSLRWEALGVLRLHYSKPLHTSCRYLCGLPNSISTKRLFFCNINTCRTFSKHTLLFSAFLYPWHILVQLFLKTKVLRCYAR